MNPIHKVEIGMSEYFTPLFIQGGIGPKSTPTFLFIIYVIFLDGQISWNCMTNATHESKDDEEVLRMACVRAWSE